MGLLSEGSPLSWEDTKSHADHVRTHGIIQFLNQFKKLRDRTKDVLYWGDEVEYMLVKFDHKNRTAKLSLNALPVLDELQKTEKEHPDNHPTTWRPEYAAYMVEGTPGKPYGGMMAHFNLVESNMKLRREEIRKLLAADEYPMSLTAFPRLGCGNFTDPITKPTPTDGASHSLFYADQVIFQGHPRFRTLTRNIRQRRGQKVAINVPIFKDKNTPSPFIEDLSQYGDNGESAKAAKPDHIYMDCMGFGMGCSCLQVTFQACNITEARKLYDQLTPLCPIMLALSAASPIYRGYLSDLDTRWTVISQSVDDRTDEERGLKPLKENKFVINKSRYDSIDSYLSCSAYSNIKLVYDKDIFEKLKSEGIDDLLARHIAHLFIRDPISLFSEKINQNDEEDTDHFENIQSTNWQTMRFKPPPPHSNIGWRVEFRPMEVQLTDFENAAYTVFLVLMTRVILTFELNFIIPLSNVDDNLRRAFKRDAIREEKFCFRKDLLTDDSPPIAEQCVIDCCEGKTCTQQDHFTQMSIDEIIHGKDDYPGLIPLIDKYIDMTEIDVDTRCTIQQYLKLISDRASGKLKTTAQWTRDFVMSHADYKHDSVVPESVNYDLLMKCAQITDGNFDPELLPVSAKSKTSDNIPPAMRKVDAYLNKKNPRNGEMTMLNNST
ncbi:glutamate--cysteine ligase catalytic subunit-like [Ruditapes philippinarum]|uniref:glutamate--cysteine ligase catalytic subunit-like n=1 Tax=Ruditapes philippinarum TaxID=129788 RepID=UPI00295B8220|nr:glutamate--cysteine ligase catalytic subunit-like [Ruditapes philippinarum]